MKKTLYFVSLLFVISSCSSSKKAQKSLASGDYDKAINIAVEKLSENKTKRANQKLIPTLKEAYDKANQRDLRQIEKFKKLNSPLYYKNIYALYQNMDVRQDDIMMLLPLYYKNQEIDFEIKDYTSEIAEARDNYSSYLLSTGKKQLAGNKMEARQAYETFNELEFVNPSYTDDIEDLIRQAKRKGSDLVLLKLYNKIAAYTTEEQIDELMRINASNMNNPWVIYQREEDPDTDYDREVNIYLDRLSISPEQVNSEIIHQQARVKDGWEYVYDQNGNVMKDSLGNDIKQDRIIVVQADVKLFQQLKTSIIDAKVEIKNLRTGDINSTPMTGEARFENVYALYNGDKRAIEEKYYKALQNKEVPFPEDSEFVKYDLAELRAKIINLLDNQCY